MNEDMTTLFQCLHSNVKQLGEKGQIEYGWSNAIKENILQFNYQLLRCSKEDMQSLECKLMYLLNHLKLTIAYNITDEEALAYLNVLYCMIGHTRDVIDGKGEYALSYMLIYTWYQYFPELAFYALKTFVNHEDPLVHPYGSWKDIKYFCKYVISKNNTMNHPFIQYSIQLYNDQLYKDYQLYLSNHNASISLVAKWIPREKSTKFSFLFEPLACDYFSKYIETAKDEHSKRRAILKCKTEYRKILSILNKHLDTLQIKQCNDGWNEIDLNHITSISFHKQINALLNIKKNGEKRFIENKEREICFENCKTYITDLLNNDTGHKIKAKHIAFHDFTKQASELIRLRKNNEDHMINSKIQLKIDLLNIQWKQHSIETKSLYKMIPIIDLSESMEGEAMNTAISLGIRIAEKSFIGRRMLTFSSHPVWIQFENNEPFVDIVERIQSSVVNVNSNFFSALDFMLNTIIDLKMKPEDVNDMILVILSDMQMEQNNDSFVTLYDAIKEKYENAGIIAHGKPYRLPHIIFWNLRNTNGFPCLSIQPNVSMFSGFRPNMLNLFSVNKNQSLTNDYSTSWSTFIKLLSNQRYKMLENHLNLFLMK